ncbi:MAG: hypothetical protein JXR86_08815 [Spirochaetales bacterium]|nr:hypothetical protein [Spirochaetales bacterium]
MIEKLMDFGLSRLEAAVYIALLGEPGITGYRLSHNLNKPTANIYKALRSLEHKGLVRMDQSAGTQLIHPVPVEEYLSVREMEFKSRSRELKEVLKKLERKNSEYRITRLDSYEQAVGKALQILEEAESVVVIVGFEETISELKDLIARRGGEGLDIIVYTYSPLVLEGCRVYHSKADAAIWNAVPERAFDIAADGKVFMISNFRNDYSEVIEALYGNHVYLSLMIFNSLSRNILFLEMEQSELLSGETRKELKTFLHEHRSLLAEELPGVRNFFRRYGIEISPGH